MTWYRVDDFGLNFRVIDDELKKICSERREEEESKGMGHKNDAYIG